MQNYISIPPSLNSLFIAALLFPDEEYNAVVKAGANQLPASRTMFIDELNVADGGLGFALAHSRPFCGLSISVLPA